MEPSTIGPHGNVYLEDNQVVDASTPLLPFRRTPGEFWTFNDCRDTTVLGYAYPETQRWKYDSNDIYQADVNAVIASLYGGRARAKLMTQHVTAGSQMLLSHNNTFTDWTIESSVAASKFPATFVVSFSLVSLFQSDPSVNVGSWMVLMPEHKNEVHTSKRPATSEKRLNGTTSITSHLIDRVNAGVLGSLEPADVVPYLSEYLTWNVYKVKSTFLAMSEMAC
jgi:tyrosinase